MNDDYLGDGVYVSYDGFQIKIKANHHERPTDTVCLDPYVTSAFLRYLKRVEHPSIKEMLK